MTHEGLTPKQQAFLDAFLETENAAEAYRRGYGSKGAAQYCAREGIRMLAHPKLAPIIEAARERASKKAIRAVITSVENYEHTRTRVLLELHRIAYVNAATLAGKMPEELTEAEGRAIKAIEITEITQKDGAKGRRVKYTLYDKRGALELIGKAMPDGSMWDEAPPPPPPPPVAADQHANGIVTTDQRKAARDRMFRLLDSLARPEPMDVEPEPPKPNGKANGTNGHGHGD